MLQKNPLCPPRPLRAEPAAARTGAAPRRDAPFLSAEDFDRTGILAGCDPCESRYWWLPELAADDACGQATRDTGSAATADA